MPLRTSGVAAQSIALIDMPGSPEHGVHRPHHSSTGESSSANALPGGHRPSDEDGEDASDELVAVPTSIDADATDEKEANAMSNTAAQTPPLNALPAKSINCLVVGGGVISPGRCCEESNPWSAKASIPESSRLMEEPNV